MNAKNMRVGHGFDVHRFSAEYDPGKPLKLAGLELAEKRSLLAHSDGDVILHAICDAILGAIAAGDIGQHFPDTSSTYANIDSTQLLSQVLELAAKKNFLLINCDVTVVAQVPKLGPYRDLMRASLADVLGIDTDRVNIKATTTERLGAIGREEGIGCHCVVLMCKDD
jgi:2-C-methyl-D-erythritol 2,4-cyclodiphosphate synthase